MVSRRRQNGWVEAHSIGVHRGGLGSRRCLTSWAEVLSHTRARGGPALDAYGTPETRADLLSGSSGVGRQVLGCRGPLAGGHCQRRMGRQSSRVAAGALPTRRGRLRPDGRRRGLQVYSKSTGALEGTVSDAVCVNIRRHKFCRCVQGPWRQIPKMVDLECPSQ